MFEIELILGYMGQRGYFGLHVNCVCVCAMEIVVLVGFCMCRYF